MRIERIFTFLTFAYMNIYNEYVFTLSKKINKEIFQKEQQIKPIL